MLNIREKAVKGFKKPKIKEMKKEFNPHSVNKLAEHLEKAIELIKNQEYIRAEGLLESILSELPVGEQCKGPLIFLRAECLIRLSEALRKQRKNWQYQISLLQESILLAEEIDKDTIPAAQRSSLNTDFLWKPYQNLGFAARKVRNFKLEEEAYLSALKNAITIKEKSKSIAYGVWAILCQGDDDKIEKAWNLVSQYDTLQKEKDFSPHLQLKIETGRALLFIKRKDFRKARIATSKANHLGYSSKIARELTRLLTSPGLSADQIFKKIIQLGSSGPKKNLNKCTLSSLPPFIASEEISDVKQNQTFVILSESEFGVFDKKIAELDYTSKYKEMENLAREALKQHTQVDDIKVDILMKLGRALFRQGQFEEALKTIDSSIRIAHSLEDPYLLITALDLRAEALVLEKEPTKALQTLSLAFRYFDEADLDNMNLECRLLHSKAMAYAELGWFEKSFLDFRAAMNIANDFKLEDQKLMLKSEYGLTVLRKALSEGANEEFLSEGYNNLNDVLEEFEAMGNIHLGFQAAIDSAHLYFFLSEAKNDTKGQIAAIETLRKQQKYQEVKQFFNHSIRHAIAFNQVLRYGLENNLFVGREREILDAQKTTLDRATKALPFIANLWREKALTYICRAKQGLDDPLEGTLLATEAMENAIDVTRKLLGKSGDSQVRAHLINSQNLLFESLGEVAFYALEKIDKPSPQIAQRMLALAQSLRVQNKEEIIRFFSDDEERVTVDEKANSLLEKLRLLNKWLDKWEASDRINTNLSWKIRSNKKYDLHLDSLKHEIGQQFPQYKLLESKEVLRSEIAKLKSHLDRYWADEKNQHLKQGLLELDSPFELGQLRARIKEGDVVLDYFIGPRKVYIGVISINELKFFEIREKGRPNLFEIAQNKLRNLDKSTSPHTLDTISDLNDCQPWLLPARLVEYLKDLRVDRLYVVASGPLWSIPFALLSVDGKFAMQKWEICYVPGAKFAGREQKLNSIDKSFAVGHPGLDDNLPNVKEEVEVVSSILDGKAIFHKEAYPQFVLQEILPEAALIHFACHGHPDAISPLFNSLELEPDEKHQDGRLFLHEIIRKPIKARIVSLFSCHTADTYGALAFPETLAHSFIGTGARYVLASQGPVGDKACLEFSKVFFTAIKDGQDPVAAFSAAQRKMIQQFAKNIRRGFNLQDEPLPDVSRFILITASDPVKSEDNVHQKEKEELDINSAWVLLKKAKQMTREFPPFVQNMGPEAQYWNTQPRFKPSLMIIKDFFETIENAKMEFLALLGSPDSNPKATIQGLEELSIIREHVKLHPRKELEVRRIARNLLYHTDRFQLSTADKIDFVARKLYMEQKPGIEDVEYFIFDRERLRISREIMANERSFSGKNLQHALSQMLSHVEMKQILSIKVKEKVKHREFATSRKSKEAAYREALAKLPEEAEIEQRQILREMSEGKVEIIANTEDEARSLFSDQYSQDKSLTAIHCLVQSKKGILGIIGKRIGRWEIHWIEPYQVSIQYTIPVEIVVQFWPSE